MGINRIRKYTVSMAGILIALGLLYYAFVPQAVLVDSVTVEFSNLEMTVNAEGVTRVRELFEITAPISGVVRRSPINVGDSVLAEQSVVAVIQAAEPGFLDARTMQQLASVVRESEASIRLADSEIVSAQADFNYAKDEFRRTQTLVNKGAISLSALESADLSLKQANAAVDTAVAQRVVRRESLERARAALLSPDEAVASTSQEACCMEIKTPVDGTVLDIFVESQRTVQQGTLLLTIGDLTKLELVVDVLSADAVRIPVGAKAYIERWGGENSLTATVTSVEPTGFAQVSALGIEEQRVRVILKLDNHHEDWQSLGDHFRVYARIVIWSSEDTLAVPVSALFRSDGRWMVFQINENTAIKTPVTIGRRNNRYAELLQGLSDGDVVIVHPGSRVVSGVAVQSRATIPST